MYTAHTKPSVHVNKSIVLVVQLTVFQQSPELHTRHDVSVVRVDVVTESAVECVDTVKAGHVTQHHKRHLQHGFTAIIGDLNRCTVDSDAVMLILVLVLKDSLRTNFKSLSLSL